MKINSLKFAVLLGVALMVGILACGGGGGGTQTGTVEGIVSNGIGATSIAEQAALSGVNVAIGSQSTTTDSTGFYRLSNVNAGRQTITATKSGYNTHTGSVTVDAGQTVTYRITLVGSSGIADTIAPSMPTHLVAHFNSSSQITLSWTASTDNHSVSAYNIYRNGMLIATVPYPVIAYSESGLNGSTRYCYQVSAIDAAGNESTKSSESCTITPATPDVTPPTAPTNLSATAVSSSQINLFWNSSTDTAMLYIIYRDGTFLKFVDDTSTSDDGLSASTLYCYHVTAIDSSGNESNVSNQACATTQAGHVTSYPPKPLPRPIIGLFLPMTPINQGYVQSGTSKAQLYGLDAVNLIVSWRDLEQREGVYSFEELHAAITTIKKANRYCILRIYFNAGESHEAAPDWFFSNGIDGVDYYVRSSNLRQPLPWSTYYQNRINSFLTHFADWFINNNGAMPDAFQIAVGGDYGEQYLAYNYQNRFDTYQSYIAKLLEAAKKHVDIHNSALLNMNAELAIMPGSLYPGDPVLNEGLISYSKQKGIKWVETNACAAKLQLCEYGPENLNMILPYINNLSFLLEDEEGSRGFSSHGGCSASIGPETVRTRVNRIVEIENLYGFKFKGVTLSYNDLIDSNSIGIANLISHFKNSPVQ